MTEPAVDRALLVVDESTATVLVSTDAKEKPFIAEALVIGAAVLLLQRYAEGFLKGAGFDDAAEQHGRRVRGFLQRLRGGELSEAELDEGRRDAEVAVVEVRGLSSSEEGLSSAEQAVADFLKEAGAIPAQADDIARGLTRAVFST